MPRLLFAEKALLIAAITLLLIRRLLAGGNRKRPQIAGGKAVGPLRQWVESGGEATHWPKNYERLGHVVSVKFATPAELVAFAPHAARFAAAFVPPVLVVVADTAGVSGELRLPSMRTLFCDRERCVDELRGMAALLRKRAMALHHKRLAPAVHDCTERFFLSPDELGDLAMSAPTFTTHIENGVRFSFDCAQVMFSSGNAKARIHFGTAVEATNEVVLDMFAGIGYFTIPLAVGSNCRSVIALEKNPRSAHFLWANAVQNHVGHKVVVLVGDNRAVGEAYVGECDRVLMGYIPECAPFLPRALAFLRKDSASGHPRGVLHYHFLADKPAARTVLAADVDAALAAVFPDARPRYDVTDLRLVKSFAPKRFHYIADVSFPTACASSIA